MKKNKILIPLLVFVAFIGGAAWSYLVIKQLDHGTILTSGSGGNYTINENSISAAVDKVYDATVVVASYKGETLVSTGTGFVYKTEGSTSYIMTNNHVVSGGDSAKVIFSDGTSADTKILGGDTYADIAVLTVSTSSIKQVATLGNTENMKLGDTVFAVGAPLGDTYSGTVTKGILSGKDRLVEVSLNGTTSDYYMKVLQTDTALNPGNSGGPLVNFNGEVIGVTSLKLVNSSIEGMGFAIKIEDAMKHVDELEKGNKIERPLLGISHVNATDTSTLRRYGVSIDSDITYGIAIVSVVDGSAADKAGLQKGDVIIKVNDDKVTNMAYLKYLLYKYKVGDTIEMTYIRGTKEMTTKVTLTENAE